MWSKPNRWTSAGRASFVGIRTNSTMFYRRSGQGREGRPGQGLGFGSVAVGSESNEIPAVPALLGVLKLGGTVVTIDDMGCRTACPQPGRLRTWWPQGHSPDAARIGPPTAAQAVKAPPGQ